MSNVTIEQIEGDIEQLSLADQLLLMERLAHTIRRSATSVQPSLDDQLAAMADDPAIQHELRLIEMEFTGTEADGLDVAA